MKSIRMIPQTAVLLALILSACGKTQPSPTPVPATQSKTSTALPIDTATTVPTASNTITPTPAPDLPCGGVVPEHIYLFLDCNDIRRIRAVHISQDPVFLADWQLTQTTLADYRSQFPTVYDTDASWNVLWWGSGNFVARDMALTYLVTGDETHASDILRLLELVRTNTPSASSLTNFDAPDGRGEEYAGGILSHPQFGAVVIQSVLFAYLAIRDTTLLEDSQRAAYDQFFQHQAELLEQAAIQRGNNNPLDGPLNRNVPFAANVAALTIARYFQEVPAMQALDDRIWPRLEWQLANWWEADGGWGENTQNYGFSMLESLMLLAETSFRNEGPDLYGMDFDGQNIHQMCRFFLEVVTPEGTTPALNDTSHYIVDPGLFTLCGFRTEDPQLYFAEEQYNRGRHDAYGVDSTSFTTPFHLLTWADLDSRPAEVPDHTSVLLARTGAAILRDGWFRDSQYALLQFTASRSHQEFSYGTLYLYAHGPWLVGNGYNIPAGRPTDQHSTLAMDYSNQTNTGGETVAFADLGSAGIAAVSSRSYPNLLHTRLVLWNKPWSQWIVVDDAVSDTNQHSLQQRWYVRGDTLQAVDNVWVFKHNGNNYALTLQMLPGLPTVYSTISRHYTWETWVSDANGVLMDVTYPGTPVRLITSLSVAAGKAPAPAVTRLDTSEGTQIDTRLENTIRSWILPAKGSTSGTVGSYTLTGTAGCAAQQNELLLGYCLMNGTALAYQGQTLVESPENINLEAYYGGGKLYLNTESATTTIHFYWPQTVTTIIDSGTILEFTNDQGLVTIKVTAGRHILEIR